MRMAMALATALAACAEKPDHVIEPGILEYFDDAVMIDVPTTTVVGEPFVVSALTYGGGCISGERTEIDSDADGADVVPLDRRAVPSGEGGFVCTANLVLFEHRATLTFDTPGTKSVRVHGRRVGLDVDEDIRIDFSVVVE